MTAIEVFTTNPDRIDVFRKSVTEAAGVRYSWSIGDSATRTFFNALQVERNVMFLILTMIVLVAALNNRFGLIMLVKDKGQDIAILRTMGGLAGLDHADLPDHGSGDRRGRYADGFFVGMLSA